MTLPTRSLCDVLGSGWTLGGDAVSDYARPEAAAVFGVVVDGREAMGAIAKRELLHATVEVAASRKS